MEFEGLEYLDELEEGFERALSKFRGSLSSVEKGLFWRLELLLGKIDLKDGRIKKTAENIRRINELRREIRFAMAEAGYAPAVKEFLSTFEASSKTMNLYFSAVMQYTLDSKALYAALVEEHMKQTTVGLMQVYEGAFEQGIVNVLRTHVTTGAPIQQLRSQMRVYVQGSERLEKMAATVADDALNQYSRNYLQAVSDDLGFAHYFYKGTKIETSRQFCLDRTGKYYTKAEVLAWASLEWSGKIAGTDRYNILTYLGGHKCRHRAAPISKRLYDLKTKK